ncbi:MAG: site-specific integrase [Candidatus Symbiothrix sp.]|jgi:site-specific recombinase XerD|nr:site-specific integrase [Candidatus Symbiothrix sp.]
MITSVHVKFRNSTIAGKEGVLYFQLIRNRKVKLITTHFRIYPEEWNAQQTAIQWENAAAERQNYLQTMDSELKKEIRQIRELIELLDKKGNYTVNEFREHYLNRSFSGNLFPFVEYLIKILANKKRIKTASIYATTLRSFARFRFGQDIVIDKIDNDILLNYEAYLKNNSMRKNSISCYMRALRAIYNQAVRKGLTTQKQPFSDIYTGVDKTIKRAVGEEIITQLKNMDLSRQKELEVARDMFMFSFYMRGMSFVDMANLRISNVKNGYITYTRSKTKQVLTVKMEVCMEKIIARYKNQTVKDYLLPIYNKDNYNHVSHLRTSNKRLKRISNLLALEKSISSYVARHSWASIAHQKGIAIEIISESMGHENETTTRIYLASLGQSVIDKANAKIIALE